MDRDAKQEAKEQDRLDKERALHKAARNGDATTLQKMLDAGFLTPSLWSKWREPPLVLAAECGHAESVKILLKACDPDEQIKESDQGGAFIGAGTALSAAILGGHRECADLLLPVSNPETLDETNGFRAVEAAIASRDAESLRFLVGRSDLKRRPGSGRTLLMIAAISGATELLPWLLPIGDAQEADNDGETAFGWAMRADEWAFADAICAVSRRAEVEDAYRFHAARLPHWRALLEREELARAAGVPGKAPGHSTAGATSADAEAPAAANKPALRV